MKNLTICFDMDGVIANFDKALEGQFEKMFKRGFFRNLEKIGNPNQTFEQLQSLGYEVYILTTAVKTSFCKQEKIEWLKEHCPSIKEENIIVCFTGDKKSDHCPTPIHRTILVDDYKENLKDWQNKGGQAVKFGNKWKSERPYSQIVSNLNQIIPLVENLEMLA